MTEEQLWLIRIAVAVCIAAALLTPAVRWWNRRNVRHACDAIVKICHKHYRIESDGRVINTEPDDADLQWLDWALYIVDAALLRGDKEVQKLLTQTEKSWAEQKVDAWDP